MNTKHIVIIQCAHRPISLNTVVFKHNWFITNWNTLKFLNVILLFHSAVISLTVEHKHWQNVSKK